MIVRPFHFRKAVTTAGTREQLTTAERHVTDLLIQATVSGAQTKQASASVSLTGHVGFR